jgi:hypothetical protein
VPRLKTRLGSLFGRSAEAAPVLSVVMPVYNVAAYLPECLDSILGQTLTELEVIAVDDGSSDGSVAVLAEYAARDPRLRVLRQPNAGQGAARNTAMPHVRGEFVTFADSDDVVPADAYETMVATLRRTGSDWILGGAQRYTHGQLLEVVRGALVHDRDRLGVDIDDFPAALQDIIPGNRVFRTAFYRDRVPPWRSDVKYEDQVPCLAAFVRGRFDVLARVTYLWRIREDASSTTQQKTTDRNLHDQLEVMRESRKLMRAEGSAAAYQAWVGRMLGVDLNGFVQPALGASDAFRDALADAYREVLADASPEAYGAMTVSAKVRTHLIASDDWAAVLDYETWAQLYGRVPPTRVVDGRVVAAPAPPGPWSGVPETLWELGEQETPLRAAVHACSVSAGELVIKGYAGIGAVDSAAHPPSVEAWLGTVPLTVTMRVDPNADVWARDLNAGFAQGAFTATVPVGALPLGAAPLHVRVTQAGVVRAGAVAEVAEWSGAARLAPLIAAGRTLTPALAEGGIVVDVAGDPTPVAVEDRPRLYITSVAVTDGIEIGVRVEGLSAEEVGTARLGTKDVLLAAACSYDGSSEAGVLRFPTRVSLPGAPDVALEPRGASIRVLRPGHPPVLAEPDPALFDVLPLHAVGPDLRLSLRRRPNGQAAIVLGAPLALEEVTRQGRGRLRTTYRTSPVPPLADAVLFQSDEGYRVDGPVLALDAALAEARPGWQRYWSVQSHHTAVPEGAIPVVIGSARWYDVLAAAPLLVGDSPFTEWLAKRPHQRLVSVAPGWPVSSLGAARAAERGLPVGQAALRADLVRQWDLLVAPSQAAADLYRRETGYAGDVVLAAPQTDLLVAPPAGLRDRVRAELGLADDTVAVLYAPTYRPSRSHRVDAAPMYAGLDLADLAARLGGGYTVLLHAHRHDRRAAERRTLRAPVLDVSDYPRLGELLLAADAAVLDYGAVRADWALTGRPAVFFTPDRAEYEDVCAPLVDYGATLGGPPATTTAEVAGLLADLPRLRAACAPLAARVGAQLNPAADGQGAARVIGRLLD